MKNHFVVIAIMLLAFACPSFGGEKTAGSFKAVVAALQKALLKGDKIELNRYLALEGIVRSKLQKYEHKAAGKSSFLIRSAGRVISLGEPAFVKAATALINSRFEKSAPEARRAYLKQLKFKKIGENGGYGFAVGTFMGQPAVISGVKTDGRWLVVGAESPVIDAEFKNLMKIIHLD